MQNEERLLLEIKACFFTNTDMNTTIKTLT